MALAKSYVKLHATRIGSKNIFWTNTLHLKSQIDTLPKYTIYIYIIYIYIYIYIRIRIHLFQVKTHIQLVHTFTHLRRYNTSNMLKNE